MFVYSCDYLRGSNGTRKLDLATSSLAHSCWCARLIPFTFPVFTTYHCKASQFLALSLWLGVGRIAFHGIYDGFFLESQNEFSVGFRGHDLGWRVTVNDGGGQGLGNKKNYMGGLSRARRDIFFVFYIQKRGMLYSFRSFCTVRVTFLTTCKIILITCTR